MTRTLLVVVLALVACGAGNVQPRVSKTAAVRSYIHAVMTDDASTVLRMNTPGSRAFALSAARDDRHDLGNEYRIVWMRDQGDWVTAMVRGVRRLTTNAPNGLLTVVRWRFLLVPSEASWQVSEEQWLLVGSCFLFPRGVKPPRGSLPCPSVPKR